jgi:hypothetical protein
LNLIPQKVCHFDVVVGRACSNGLDSYAGGSVATGRASNARPVKGDDLDKKEYPAPPGCVLDVGLKTATRKNMLFW